MPIPAEMNKYKSEFILKFAKIMQENLLIWKGMQETYKRKLYTRDLVWYFMAFFAGLFFSGQDASLNIFVRAVVGLCFATVVVFVMISYENGKYQTEIKRTLLPKLITVFGENIKYGCGYIDDSEFEHSMLYDHNIETRSDDDCFEGTYNGVKFVMNETDFGYYGHDSKGRRRYYSLFNGVAMRFNMKKFIKTRVLIKYKGWFNTPPGFEKVRLESSALTKNYDVFVNKSSGMEGQIEARYLLNTGFMDRYMQLKTSFRAGGIEMSACGDVMLVMLSTSCNLFEVNDLFKKIDDQSQYEKLFNEFASVLSFMDVLNLSSKTGL